MNSDWEVRRVGDCIELVYGKGLPKRKRIMGTVPIYGSNGIIDFHNNALVSGPGIIIGRKGSVGKIKLSKIDFWPIDTTYYLKLEKDNELHFWYYLLKTLKLNLMNTHSAVPGLNRENVYEIIRPIPNFQEQTNISAILCSLDQKIELNQKMNQTLEEIGQAIFKRWFVDFEFPDENGNPYKSSGGEMVDSELGEIPKGWEVSNLKDFGKVICGKTPPKSRHEYFNGKVPFIKIPDMHGQTFVVKTEDTLSEEGKDFQANKTIPPKSICVSCIATVGLVCINDKESQTNQQINSIIPNYDYLTPFLYFKLSSMKDFLKILASGGSATLNLNTKNFSNIKIANPESFIMKNYYNIINHLFEAILINSQENKYLSKIRDSLLPKLMSGKIRVNIPEEATAK